MGDVAQLDSRLATGQDDEAPERLERPPCRRGIRRGDQESAADGTSGIFRDHHGRIAPPAKDPAEAADYADGSIGLPEAFLELPLLAASFLRFFSTFLWAAAIT